MTSLIGNFLMVGCVLIAACGPPKAPRQSPEPRPEESTVTFDGGTLRVVTGECDEVDLATIREWADRAHRDLSEVWPGRADRFRVDGLVMYGMLEPISNGKPAYGYWDRKRQTVVYQCGVERVIRHELFHVWCDRTDLPCNCTWIDHPDGFGLDCAPQEK